MPLIKYFLGWSLVLLLIVPAGAAAAGDESTGGWFPDLDGWTKDGEPELYYSDNLWEYINGAADFFILYDFQKVATLTYDKEPKQSLTIDIYEHSSPRNAFGIYSQERPGQGNFLPLGAQGYHDKGILNFFQGNYYVKLMGFYLGEEEAAFLDTVARSVASKLGGETVFPGMLDCFPQEGKIENSERYIAKDFLGRSFLRSAYVAEYNQGEDKKRLFIIEAADAAEAQAMVEKYLEKVKVTPDEASSKENLYRFEDPYFKSDGLMNLKINGRFVWGLFCDDEKMAADYINSIEKQLAKNQAK